MTIARLVLVSVLLGGAETVLDLHLGFRSLAVSVEELFCLRAVLAASAEEIRLQLAPLLDGQQRRG